VSGRNQLAGKVVSVRIEGLLAEVILAIGDADVTAIITADAARELSLQKGDPVAALIKSTRFERQAAESMKGGLDVREEDGRRENAEIHDLRHHFISALAQTQTPDATIQAISGHLSRNMLEHFSDVRLEAKRRAVEALDAIGAPAYAVR
jgi:molybdopterin-binding protein